MKKVLSMFVVLLMSMTMWGAASSVPENAPDVMLQAFYWDSYPANSSNLSYGNTGWSALLSQVDELGEYFDLVWLPPCSQSSGGTGYIPKQYSNLYSDWGSETDLRSLISQLKAKGTRSVADIVVNHITGNYGWCSFATMDFGSYGKFSPDASWICKTDEMNSDSGAGDCKGKATGDYDDGYGDEANYTAARDWDHKNSNVQAMCRAYLKWLKNDVGFDGWRYDYGKGFHHSHINDYNSAAEAYMSVVEYWDGNSGVIRSRLEDASWNNMAFDFGTKYDALNNGICSFDYSKCKGAGLLGAGLSKHAVTFVDNHDTFQRNSSEFGGQNNSMSNDLKDRLLQANAYILSMPGIPCVFYPHWVTYKSEIKKMIEARHLTGVHSQSAVSDEATGKGYKATITGKNGKIILQLGDKVTNYEANYTKYASGNGYAIWIPTSLVKVDEFYISGNAALVGDKAWDASAIKVTGNTYTFTNLAAGKDYQLKITTDGTWNTAKGFNDLTTTADGLSGANDGNICFSLSEAGNVTVTYTGAVFKLEGKFATSGSGSGEQQTTTKFYITGNDALVGDKAWNPAAIASTEDSYTFENLATGKDYKLKVTTDGTWNTAKGYNNLTAQTDGLSGDSDGNICFSLSEAGDVKVTYTGSVFKVEGKFVTAGSGSGDDPQPASKYYLKNNWNGGSDWTWKEMTAAENNTFKLEKVVFGGTGVNYNTEEKDANAKWVAADAFDGDEIGALDTVTFVLDLAAEKKVKAILLGKYKEEQGGGDDPQQPVDSVTVYFVNNLSWANVYGFVWPAEGNAPKDWPGETLKKEADKLQGYDVYAYKFPQTCVNIIFNAGKDKDQTIDLKWDATKPYFVPSEKDGEGKYKGTWYAKDDVPASGSGSGDDPQPASKYYLKNNWNGGSDWTWKEMTAAENNTFKLEKVVFGGTGVNYNTEEKDANAKWVAADAFDGDEIGALDTVTFVLDLAAEKKVKAILLGKYKEEQGGGDDPQQPVDSVTVYFVNNLSWTNVYGFVWPAEGNAPKDWPGEALKKEADKLQGYDVYAYKFPQSCVNIIFNAGKDKDQTIDLKWDATKPYFVPSEKDSEGKYKGTWYAKDDVPASGSGSGDDPQPASKYYLKNNWNGGSDWTWKEMTAAENNTFKLEKVVFGGTGVNYNTAEKDEGAEWVAADAFDGDEIGALDTVTFVLDLAAEKKVKAILLGKYKEEQGGGDDPQQPVDSVTVYFVNNLSWANVYGFVWPAEGNAPKDWPGEALKKESDKLQGYDVYAYKFPQSCVNIIFNAGKDKDQTIDLKWDATKPYFVPSEKDGEGKYEGTWYAKDDVPASGSGSGDDPQPAISYYLVGSFNSWKLETAEAMDGDSIVREFEAGSVEFKVLPQKTAWDNAMGAAAVNAECSSDGVGSSDDGNVKITLKEAGKVKVKVVGGKLCVTGIFESGEQGGGDDPQPAINYYLVGSFNSWKLETAEAMDGDSIVREFEAGSVEFKVLPQKTAWDNAMGAAAVNAECSSDGVGSSDDGNVKVTLKEAGKVKVKVVGGKLCVTGIFESGEQGGGDDPQPASKYYLKNNWNGGSDWTWKEMTAAENNTFKLEKVVFGGTGVNYNTAEKDEGAEWVEVADFAGDEIGALDTVTFVLDLAAEKKVKAILLGKYKEEQGGGDDPQQPVDSVTVYFVNNLSWANVYGFVWPAEGNAPKDWPGETLKKEADKLQGYDVYAYKFPQTCVNIIFNAGKDKDQTIDLKWDATKPYFVPSEKDSESKYQGTWYAKDDVPASGSGSGDDPQPASKYYLKNNWNGGSDWTWKEMTAAENNTFKLEKVVFGGTGVNYNTEEKDANAKWVAADAFAGDEIGALDTVTFVLDLAAEKKVKAILLGKYKEEQGGGDDPQPSEIPVVKLAGSLTSWEEPVLMVTAEDKLSASLKLHLGIDHYQLKVVSDGNWLSKAGVDDLYTMHRDWNHVDHLDLINSGDNIKLVTDVEGEYIFTWTFADSTLVVTFPEAGGGDEPGGDDPQPTVADGYYLMGTMNGWTPTKEYLFTVNPENANEYYLNVTLDIDDELKVAQVVSGESVDWYPKGDNYKVDAKHAGAKIIYFQASYKEAWKEFGGFFYIEPNIGTGVDNSQSGVHYQKVIENGQLFILRDGRIYTPAGQFVR